MAGGKETPRQKMIGMMYLVLTALLALNVSKQVLDAFVAIEENTQKSSITHLDRGNSAKSDLSGELADKTNPIEKIKKIKYYLGIIDQIDAETAKRIKEIDDLKLNILKESGEDITKIKDKDKESIVWVPYSKANPLLPTRLNLMAVQAKDQYDVPMHIIVGEEIKNPKGDGLKLWNSYNDFRNTVCKLVGTYKIGTKGYTLNPTNINKFKDNDDLAKQVDIMFAKNKVNINDDGEVIKNIYMELTKPERVDMDEEKGVHWIGKTFDHAPLVGAIASLTALQQEILAARASAVAHIKSRVSTGEYSFNKIVGLAYGPAVANSGDEVELKVMMAAFDTDNQPTVTGPGAITVADGQGIVKVRVSGGAEMPVSGTVSIKNKSGATKTEKWTHTIKIMKPQGTVSLPDLRVLYRGYSNMVEAVASGYDQTTISGAGVSLSKSGAQWVATPGPGKTCSISVFGKNSITNKSVNLGSFTFDIKSMPKAEIYWGKASDGEKVSSRTAKNLYAGYGEAIPLTKAKFNVTQWAMSIPGAPKTVVGQGSTLSDEAMRYLKAAPAGSQVMFSCVYSGTGVSNKTATSAFKL